MRENETFNQPVWNEELIISTQTRSYLAKIVAWTKFLSITGFVMIGLSIIMILFTGTLITGMNRYMEIREMYPYTPGAFQWYYAIVYLIIACIYFLPYYYLFRFSNRMKNALETNNSNSVTEAFHFLKNHYMIIGIFMIIGLAFFLFLFLFMLTTMGLLM